LSLFRWQRPLFTMSSNASRLRFAVGDVVLCNMGRQGWAPARIVALYPRLPSGETSPYQVELDGGDMAYVPKDDPRVVREASGEEVTRIKRKAAFADEVSRKSAPCHEAQLAAAGRLQHDSPNVASLLTFHAESSHIRPGVYAKGGSMDWDSQPNKFRRFLGSACVDLPQSGPHAEVHGDPFSLQSLGILLHDALGLTAWKRSGHAKWTLRANPSGGALQPLEAYILGRVGDDEPHHWHYNPFWHCLERLAPLPAARWSDLEKMLPVGAVVLGLTPL